MRAVVSFRSAMLRMAAHCWVVATGLGMANAKGEPTGMITSTDLLETGEKQRRWLSLPQSRIVVNPYNFWSPLRPFQYNNGPDLPLHIGYYVGGEGLTLERLLMLRFDGRTADSFSTAWTPHALPFEAEFERMTVRGADFLYDLDTVVRRMEVVPREVVPKTEASSRAEAPGEATGT